MNPYDEMDDFLPTLEPSPDLARRVMARIHELEALRSQLEAEERHSDALRVVGMVAVGATAGILLANRLLPALPAARATSLYVLQWLQATAHSSSGPGLVAAVAAAVGTWLALRHFADRREPANPSADPM